MFPFPFPNCTLIFLLQDDKFLRRLIMTKAKSNQSEQSESISCFQILGLNIMSSLLSEKNIAKDFVDLAPSFLFWINTLPIDHADSWIDAVQCLFHLIKERKDNSILAYPSFCSSIVAGLNVHCQCPEVQRAWQHIDEEATSSFDAKSNFDAMMKLG